jgi:hypothetical protein
MAGFENRRGATIWVVSTGSAEDGRSQLALGRKAEQIQRGAIRIAPSRRTSSPLK